MDVHLVQVLLSAILAKKVIHKVQIAINVLMVIIRKVI